MQQQIQTYYQKVFPDKQNIRISEPQRIAEGWETEIFSFEIDYTLAGEPVHENIIMRMFPSNDAHEKSVEEFTAMHQLYDAGYPVPQVYHLEQENSPWGKPFMLMQRIEGGIMWPELVHAPEDKQQTLLTQFCALFLRLHQLDWRLFAGDHSHIDLDDKYQFIDNFFALSAKQFAQFDLPGFMPVINWLQERRDDVPCDQPAPIHHDFHPANIILRPDGAAVVLDWSGFDISDVRFDLAWTIVLVGSYEGTIWRDRILQTYERLVGVSVAKIEYFEVVACVRRLFFIVVSVMSGADKMGMDPNAVALIKEQMYAHRRVYDLLIEKTGIRVDEVENMFASFS